MRAKSTGVIEPRGSDHLGERQQRIAVEIINTVGLVAHNKRTLTYRILGRDPRRTLVGMTGERLDAADREHEAPPRIRTEEQTSELQSLMRISYAVFCLHKKTQVYLNRHSTSHTSS